MVVNSEMTAWGRRHIRILHLISPSGHVTAIHPLLAIHVAHHLQLIIPVLGICMAMWNLIIPLILGSGSVSGQFSGVDPRTVAFLSSRW